MAVKKNSKFVLVLVCVAVFWGERVIACGIEQVSVGQYEFGEKAGYRVYNDGFSLSQHQETFSEEPTPYPLDDEPVDSEGWLQKFWGTPASNRLYLGMWTYHFQKEKKKEGKGKGQDWNNQLLAFSYNGYYGGTFINTHSDRVVTLGVQRSWVQTSYGEAQVELGYRLGMMYGYTKYLTLFNTRFFPLFQVITDIDYKGLGIELSWAGVVATVGFSIRF
ncbi:hypothetical protein [Endozoicomonas sp. Mp262]|uniref:hypothetical protein n=1 Tax=Endozoicomonas sp. Mp262 TaxID=2919499 RepID=UPI0021D95DF1